MPTSFALEQTDTQSQSAQGNNILQMTTYGNNSPVTILANQLFYSEFVKEEVAKTGSRDLVDDEEIENFFRGLQFILINEGKKMSGEKLETLPTYLQTPYDINVTVSATHGIGYEFTTPSIKPEVNIVRTEMPIEKHFFSKYTDKLDYTNAEIFRIGESARGLMFDSVLRGPKIIGVERGGSVLLANVNVQYSFDDTRKDIKFLRIFGNNEKVYWGSIKPEDEVKFLYDTFQEYYYSPAYPLSDTLGADSYLISVYPAGKPIFSVHPLKRIEAFQNSFRANIPFSLDMPYPIIDLLIEVQGSQINGNIQLEGNGTKVPGDNRTMNGNASGYYLKLAGGDYDISIPLKAKEATFDIIFTYKNHSYKKVSRKFNVTKNKVEEVPFFNKGGNL